MASLHKLYWKQRSIAREMCMGCSFGNGYNHRMLHIIPRIVWLNFCGLTFLFIFPKQTKLWFQGDQQHKKKMYLFPWILPGQNNQPCNLWEILRQPHYFEKTVYSHGHNSWETEPMTNICVMKLCISNLRKMKHGRSQFTCNLTLPPLKQNRGT